MAEEWMKLDENKNEGLLNDIEDLFIDDDITPKERYTNKKDVTIRSRKKIKIDAKEEVYLEKKILQSIIPGTQSVYVKTWGCAHNSSDSEYMAGQLASYGYNLSEDKWDADLWLLNSCTVKSPAEDHFRNEIELGQKRGKHVVVAGCVPQGMPRSGYLKGLSIVGVQQIDRIVEVVEETLKGHTVRLFGKKKTEDGKKAGGASLLLPKVRRNPLIEIIAINTGCLNQCTYCKTKHARGELGSYPPEEIIARAKQSFQEGVCEIWLTSEDTGTYGRDIGTSLPELLHKLVEVIPFGCRLRLGMTNPPYILEHLDEMAKIFNHPRVYKFLHIPVQSGSDQVLSDMKREYSVAEFENVVNFLREKVPGISIATDIICGFPTETDEDFQDTVNLCKKYKFPSLFINQFFPRPGTPAAKMPRAAPPQEVKKRTKELSEFFNSYTMYNNREGEIHEVLVTDVSHDKKYYVSHNILYEQVLVPKEDRFIGKLLTVKVTSVSKFCMFGEPIDQKISSPSLTSPLKNGQVSGCTVIEDKVESSMQKGMVIGFLFLLFAFIIKIILLVYKK